MVMDKHFVDIRDKINSHKFVKVAIIKEENKFLLIEFCNKCEAFIENYSLSIPEDWNHIKDRFESREDILLPEDDCLTKLETCEEHKEKISLLMKKYNLEMLLELEKEENKKF